MPQRSVITIGNFDGVHLGHRAILSRAAAVAAARGVMLKAVTFEPHPVTVLRPELAPRRLSDRQEKLALLHAAGAAEVLVLEPTPDLLSFEPEAFITRLVTEHHPVAVVEGPDFRFGHDRRGDLILLAELGEQHDFETISVDRTEATLSDQLLVPVSSSLIRWLLGHGRVADAAICLARPYALTAAVIEGEKRGRTLGVPTVNLDMAQLERRALPADAVYLGLAVLASGATFPAAISVGVKPTFGRARRIIEAHLLEFNADLYGQRVALRFTRWLRDQQSFPSVEELRRQLQRDLAAARYLDEAGLLAPVRKERLAG